MWFPSGLSKTVGSVFVSFLSVSFLSNVKLGGDPVEAIVGTVTGVVDGLIVGTLLLSPFVYTKDM